MCSVSDEPDWREIAERARRRAWQLERRCVFLAAENDRLNRLLACTLTIAVAVDGQGVDEGRLREVVAAITGDDLGRAAAVT